MNDIQLGDIITMFVPHYKEVRQLQLLYIPLQPGQPWAVKDVLDGKKWTIPPSQNFSRTMTR